MAKDKTVDDPFVDDDWGNEDTPDAVTAEDVPDAPTDERPQYIKPIHVGGAKKTGTFELVKFTNETTEYSDVVLLVKYRNRFFKLGMKIFAEDYKRLQKRFGKKRADWHGTLQFKVMAHKGNPAGYIAVK